LISFKKTVSFAILAKAKDLKKYLNDWLKQDMQWVKFDLFWRQNSPLLFVKRLNKIA
jgi:hypothetical protein